MDADPTALEKFNRHIPKTIREIFLIGLAITFLLIGLPPAVVLSPLGTALATLLVTYFAERKPKEHIFWRDLGVFLDVASQILPPGEVTPENIADIQNGRCELLLSGIEQNAFLSHALIVTTSASGEFQRNQIAVKVRISEVSARDLQSRSWLGEVFRVGIYTRPNEEVYLWFTANIKEFLKTHPRPATRYFIAPTPPPQE